MVLVRTALRETRQQLGLNVPTTLTTALTIGLTLALHNKFTKPDPDSISSIALWSIESVGWCLAVTGVFLIWVLLNLERARRRHRCIEASLLLEAELAESADQRLKRFLGNSLSQAAYGVARCFAFGSVVRDHPTRDVDVVIQFSTSNPNEIRLNRQRLREVERSFNQVYGHRLHLQMFLRSEDEELQDFLTRAGDYERLF